MRRSVLLLFVILSAALAGFGVLADRALVHEASTSAELVAARKGQDARTAALSVRGAVQQIEQSVLAGRSVPGTRSESLALPPSPSVSSGRPYRDRPRAELTALLQSTATTGSALPEAVVAALALRTDVSFPDMADRLLSGQLPVRPDDVPQLATALGAASDPRVLDLQRRLRQFPDAIELPEAPSFRRTIADGHLLGWARRARTSLHYEVPIDALLTQAGIGDRARAAGAAEADAGAGTRATVPDIQDFSLLVSSEAVPVRRLRAARGTLWFAVAACLLALALVQRALARESRAVSREKAFVAGVTHELRTPVAAIRVFGETLADGRGDAREYGALVAEESERLEALVERVLAATRMGEAPSFAPVAPADVMSSAVELMRPRAMRRDVGLHLQNGIDLGDARWDADGVRRALLNLIDNAIKHGRAAGHVEVFADIAGEHVRMSVRDDGPGIGRREQRRVFGRFQRGSTETPGAGLGLYLVDEVARAHGGRVDLASSEGMGCTFTLILPRVPPGSLGKEDV